MSENRPNSSNPASEPLDIAFPPLGELFEECLEKKRSIVDGDYEFSSDFRENYLRYNANANVYAWMDVKRYSALIRRKDGITNIPATVFREAAAAVPYYNALMLYRKTTISTLGILGYTSKEDLKTFLEASRNDKKMPLTDSDEPRFKEAASSVISNKYPAFSIDEINIAIDRLIRFMTDYDWWHGKKSIDRGNDFFVSPTLVVLGKAAASSEIIAYIVRDYSNDAALYKSAFDITLVSSGDDAPATAKPDPERKKTGNNVMLYGAPGTGKSWFIEHELYSNAKLLRTVFHPEYSYFDFVGSYKPSPVYLATSETMLNADGSASSLQGRPTIDYTFVPGPFVQAVILAQENPQTNYCLVIDEINRANASAVFGDMFQLLDRNDDHESEYGIFPQPELANYLRRCGHDELAASFVIPSNLSIAATMNNADLGVTYLDTAFKRRWSFTYIPIDLKKNAALFHSAVYNGLDLTLHDIFKAINLKLKSLHVNEDRWVGPFFASPQEIDQRGELEALKKVAMYLWDDVFRNNRSLFFSSEIDSLSEIEIQLSEEDPFLIMNQLDEIRADNAMKAEVDPDDEDPSDAELEVDEV